MTKDEALKLALEALENYKSFIDDAHIIEGQYHWLNGSSEAITAIKEVLAQPAPPPECKTEAEQTAYAFGWWKALETVRTKQPAQEPVAIYRAGQAKGEAFHVEFLKVMDADEVLLYTNPQPQEPRNFCSRCGKRTADLTVIHTCTPPRGLEMT